MKRFYHIHGPGLLFVALTFFVGIAAVNRPNNIVVWVFGVLLGLFLVSGIINHSMLTRLRIRRLDAQRAAVGDPLELRYELSNRARRSAFAVWVREVPRGSVRDGDLLAAAGGACAEAFAGRVLPRDVQMVELVLWPKRRGVLALDRIRVSSFFPLGLIGRSIEFDLRQRVLVLPQVFPLRFGILGDVIEQEVGGVRMSRRLGPGGEFYSVREFQPGDSIRQIAWKRSARDGALHVVQRSSSAPPRIRIVLDLSVESSLLRFNAEGGATAVALEERAIEMAASIIVAAENAGHEFGLTVLGFGDRPALLRRGHWHRERLLSSLAGINLHEERRAPTARLAENDERAATVVIHVGRINTDRAAERAWHWSAMRSDELLDLNEITSSDPTQSMPIAERVA